MPDFDIIVPRETVNDEVVTVVNWTAKSGQKVVKGQPLVSIETSKSVFEVNAEADGYLEILCKENSEVAVGALLGKIRSTPFSQSTPLSAGPVRSAFPASQINTTQLLSRAPPAEQVAQMTPMDLSQAGSSNVPPGIISDRFSRQALKALESHSLDPIILAGRGLVREADVLSHVKRTPANDGSPVEPPQADREINIPAVECAPLDVWPNASGSNSNAAKSGPPRGVPEKQLGLWHDLRTSARDRGCSAVWLVWNYFWKGWLLRNLVRWAPYGMPQRIHRLRGVKVGAGCFIDPTAIVETIYGENVSIGDDVRISAGATIITHIKAPHYLRELELVPLVKRPVVLEDHCFIGINAIIMPGVTVGRGSVVASGAVVLGNVPPFCTVAGNPAKVVKRFAVKARLA